jgi:hypothetical protein
VPALRAGWLSARRWGCARSLQWQGGRAAAYLRVVVRHGDQRVTGLGGAGGEEGCKSRVGEGKLEIEVDVRALAVATVENP